MHVFFPKHALAHSSTTHTLPVCTLTIQTLHAQMDDTAVMDSCRSAADRYGPGRDALADVVLCVPASRGVGRVRFHARRDVLSARSAVFRAMFASGMRESREREVRLDGVTPRGVLCVLDHAYGVPGPHATADLGVPESHGTVDLGYYMDALADAAEAAALYQVEDLLHQLGRELCRAALGAVRRGLFAEAVGCMRVAERAGLDDARRRAATYVALMLLRRGHAHDPTAADAGAARSPGTAALSLAARIELLERDELRFVLAPRNGSYGAARIARNVPHSVSYRVANIPSYGADPLFCSADPVPHPVSYSPDPMPRPVSYGADPVPHSVADGPPPAYSVLHPVPYSADPVADGARSAYPVADGARSAYSVPHPVSYSADPVADGARSAYPVADGARSAYAVVSLLVLWCERRRDWTPLASLLGECVEWGGATRHELALLARHVVPRVPCDRVRTILKDRMLCSLLRLPAGSLEPAARRPAPKRGLDATAASDDAATRLPAKKRALVPDRCRCLPPTVACAHADVPST